MLWAGEEGLAHANVSSEFLKDHIEEPGHEHDGQDCVCPQTMCKLLSNVGDGVSIQSMDFVRVSSLVDWQENGDDDEGSGKEELEQHAQEAQEEVGIEAALLDEGEVVGGEERVEPSDEASRRLRDSFAFGHEV